MTQDGAQALSGIRVLDLSQHISGPYCGLLLADLGAEVVRIDPPGGTDDRRFGPISPNGDSYHFIGKARNKKSITLDVFQEEGREILYRLVEKSDIVLENYSSEAKEKAGVDYKALTRRNAPIVLVSICGFEPCGPYSGRTAFDATAQAFTGSMSLTGFPEGAPTRSGVPWVDYSTALHAAVGAIAALRYRDKTGKGQVVTISLVDSAFNLVAMQGAVIEHKLLGMERSRIGNRSRYGYANSFQARDGWVFISVIRNAIWRRLCQTIGREDLKDDPRFATIAAREKSDNRDALDSILSEWSSKRACKDIVSIFDKAKVPCSKVNTATEAIREIQVANPRIMSEVDQPGVGKVPVCGMVIDMSETPTSIVRPSPTPGEHNAEYYSGLLGYDEKTIRDLKSRKVI